ncbi:TadE/TadG family type IV pilus assembly protein [Sphingomicrobium sediminis]|uniref:Pilus assembly protein n=1 Tax=Sphingomicrobium sediminis TaxID=2950949 RepID=A0A9X2EFU1_9SPHN|nr:TadE/TadG family type IV pilus assembly protein [Sphingomicrobium sediminis]MCM8557193.1 pilus assembly protein [Sphingomicrobium sediminis]
MIHLVKLGKDKKGSATIELAIVAPIMALMVTGVVDLSMAYGRKLVIEQGAQRALEKVKLTTTTLAVDENLKAEAAAAANVGADKVTVTYTLKCDGVTALDYNTDCLSTQVETRYINIVIKELYEPVIDPRYIGLPNENGKMPMTVEVGMRTY